MGAATTAFLWENTFGPGSAQFTVGITGKITGATGLSLNNSGSVGTYNIVNHGEISGSTNAVNIIGNSQTSIINYGLIAGAAGGSIKFESGATGRIQIFNYGQIGKFAEGFSVLGTTGTIFNIANRGQIFGSFYLGDSDDVVRNKGEIFLGPTVFGLELRGGNDLFDARQGSVIGEISIDRSFLINMGTGDDRYIAGIAEETVDGSYGESDILDFRFTSGVTFALDGSLDATGVADGDSYVNFEIVWGSNVGADVIRGDVGGNVLIGNGGADTLEGLAGNDTIRGGRGADILDGGDGIDIADYSEKTLAVSVTVDGTASFDVLVGGVLEENVKNFEGASGGIGDDVLKGNAGANIFYGNGGKDILDGGVDTVADTLIGGLGDDTYIVRSANDIVTEILNGGTDKVRCAVSFVLTAGSDVQLLETVNAAALTAINLTGNVARQTITGNAGINRIDGGGGSDFLIGLAGNDIYTVDSTDDVVVEAIAGGTDTVRSSVSYVLDSTAEIELLRTTSDAGTGNMDLTGNDFGQTIIGNAGNNIIAGRLGNDTLTGGAGIDVFGFDRAPDAATNIDTITDFNLADDTIVLVGTVFTGLGPANTPLSPLLFKNLTTGGAVDADDRILYDDNTGVISYDSDGSGANAAIAFAVLTSTPTVTAADFFIF